MQHHRLAIGVSILIRNSRQFALGLLVLRADPILNTPARLEMPIDVVEALIPSLHAPAVQLPDLKTESAPEATLSAAADTRELDLVLDLLFPERAVLLVEMFLERLEVPEDVSARPDEVMLATDAAPPHFGLEVLRVLVTFPIVLAAESFTAFREGAAVWAGVALLVLLPVAFS